LQIVDTVNPDFSYKQGVLVIDSVYFEASGTNNQLIAVLPSFKE